MRGLDVVCVLCGFYFICLYLDFVCLKVCCLFALYGFSVRFVGLSVDFVCFGLTLSMICCFMVVIVF